MSEPSIRDHGQKLIDFVGIRLFIVVFLITLDLLANRVMKLIFLALAVLTAVLVLAIKLLPWWVSLLIFTIGGLGVFLGSKILLKRLFLTPFKMKGKVLAESAVRVHGVSAAPTPTPRQFEDEEVDEEATQRYRSLKWYFLDVSIRPSDQTEGCGFTLWEPSELLLVPSDTKAKDLETGLDSDCCTIHDFKMFQEGKFIEDEEGKYEGSQRVQFYIGVEPNVKQLRFRYYFELFGLVTLPALVLPPSVPLNLEPKAG
jgi:hypothetical protein